MRTFGLLWLVVVVACGPAAKPPETTGGETIADASSPSVADASVPVTATVVDAAVSVPVADVVDSSAPVMDACGGAAGPYEAKVRLEVKKCFFEAKKTHPALTGEIHVGINVSPQGEMQKAVIREDKEIGKDGTACMMRALKAEKFDGSGCKSKSITFAMAFGAAAK